MPSKKRAAAIYSTMVLILFVSQLTTMIVEASPKKCFTCTNCPDPYSPSSSTEIQACNTDQEYLCQTVVHNNGYTTRGCTPVYSCRTGSYWAGSTQTITCCSTDLCNISFGSKLSENIYLILISLMVGFFFLGH